MPFCFSSWIEHPYTQIIYIAHRSALLTWTWVSHFLQHGTFKGALGNFTCWQVWKTRLNLNSAHYIAEQSVVFYKKRMKERRKFKLGRLEIVHSLLEAGLKYWFEIFCGWKSDRIWNQNLIWANKVQLQGLCRDGSGLFWRILMIKYHSFIKHRDSGLEQLILYADTVRSLQSLQTTGWSTESMTWYKFN